MTEQKPLNKIVWTPKYADPHTAMANCCISVTKGITYCSASMCQPPWMLDLREKVACRTSMVDTGVLYCWILNGTYPIITSQGERETIVHPVCKLPKLNRNKNGKNVTSGSDTATYMPWWRDQKSSGCAVFTIQEPSIVEAYRGFHRQQLSQDSIC